MVVRRGNRKVYPKQPRTDDEIWDIEKGKELLDRTYDGVRITWQHAVKRKNADPLVTLYDEVKTFQFRRDANRRDAVRCEDFSRALELMALATGDARFRGAADAMRERGLAAGGIRETLIAMADNDMFKGDVIAMPCVHGWIEWLKRNDRRASVEKAAMLAAVELKIPGISFAAVVDKLRKKYPKWLSAGGGRVSW
jgi:hypothetical protein